MKTTLEEEKRYRRVVGELLAEFVRQLTDAINQTRDPEQIFAKIEEGSLAILFDEILGGGMRSAVSRHMSLHLSKTCWIGDCPESGCHWNKLQ